MKASVVVPVFNKAPFLRECLDSVFAGSFGAFEVIAVDDRSTDDSLAILRSYADPRLRIIALEHNVGPGLAAQTGMDAAQGEYILRVDADDVQSPDRFAKQIAFMDAHPEVGVSGGALEMMDGGEVRRRPADDVECRVELLFGVAVRQPTMVLRRSVLLRHGIRFMEAWPRYGEDWMLQVDAAAHTRFANLPDVLTRYRWGAGSTSHGRDRIVELKELFRHAFTGLGFPEPSEEELVLHLITAKLFERPLDARTVKAFRQWLDVIVQRNAQVRALDPVVLQRRCDRAWEELFHFLPAFGWRACWAYWRAGGRLTPARTYYLLRSFMVPSNKRNHPRA